MPCLSIKAFNQGELHEGQKVFSFLLSISYLAIKRTEAHDVTELEFLFILSPHG